MGISLRLKNGRLVLVKNKEQSGIKAPSKVLLGVSHRKKPKAGDKIVPMSSSAKPLRRPMFRSSHRSLARAAGTKLAQKFWRVVDLHKLREERPQGEQRLTIKDATLSGSVAGRTLTIARINAERFYGLSLLDEDHYTLIQSDRWRAVRHLKTWPVSEDEEEDAGEILSGIADALAW